MRVFQSLLSANHTLGLCLALHSHLQRKDQALQCRVTVTFAKPGQYLQHCMRQYSSSTLSGNSSHAHTARGDCDTYHCKYRHRAHCLHSKSQPGSGCDGLAFRRPPTASPVRGGRRVSCVPVSSELCACIVCGELCACIV